MIDLRHLVRVGALSALDLRFAETVTRLVHHRGADDGSDAAARHHVRLAAALASRAVQRGHVCAHLERLASEPLLDADGLPVATAIELALLAGLASLRDSPLVSDGSRPTPLVLDASARLYLYRYFDYERRLARALRRRAAVVPAIDEALLGQGLERMFGVDSHDNEQRRAAATAVRRSLTIISGGPGTGKTTTVANILALLAEQAEARGEPIRIQLVAPTGKAAQRMAESLQARVANLDTGDAVRAAIPREASTIHRALGYQPRTPTQFRHGRHSPMSVDVLLADEASMIDLALMTKLVEAVPESARLILLGDKEQLASVEAGAVLADLWDAPALSNCVSNLTKSYRFGENSGIAALARAISQGDARRALEVLHGEQEMPYGEVALKPAVQEAATLPDELGVIATAGYAQLFSPGTPEQRLEQLNRFRILCAHRSGPAGVEAINTAVERHLRDCGLIRERALFYDGRPIIITANDHQLGLFNGDVGLVCRASRGDGRRVFFGGREKVRAIPVGRLPPHETVFAMTVHKSQGSELDRVALVLPITPSPLLTRELLYTAVTRARAHVDVFGSQAVLRYGIGRRIERRSGLSERLQ